MAASWSTQDSKGPQEEDWAGSGVSKHTEYCNAHTNIVKRDSPRIPQDGDAEQGASKRNTLGLPAIGLDAGNGCQALSRESRGTSHQREEGGPPGFTQRLWPLNCHMPSQIVASCRNKTDVTASLTKQRNFLFPGNDLKNQRSFLFPGNDLKNLRLIDWVTAEGTFFPREVITAKALRKQHSSRVPGY